MNDKTVIRTSNTMSQRLRAAANGCEGFDSEARLMCEAADALDRMPTEVRRLAQVWRDDALEAAAKICDRYGLDGYGAGHDIRFLKSKPPLESKE